MKKQTVVSFFVGLMIGAMVFGSSIAYARSEGIMVDFIPLNYFFNGVQKYPAYDQQGFTYNGRTYVPLRFMAEASGLSVDWDGNTNSIYVTGGTSGSIFPPKNIAGKYMSDIIEPYYKDIYDCSVNPSMSVGGHNYFKGYQMYDGYYDGTMRTVSFNLDAKYNNITGFLGFNKYSGGNETLIQFYGDDMLLGSYTIINGDLPKEVSINVAGISKFDVKIANDYYSTVDFVDVIIK